MSAPVGAPDADTVARMFGLGRAHGSLHFVARGQSNPLGVWRLHSDAGRFAVKLYAQKPNADAQLIEVAAFDAGAPLPKPIATPSGEYYAPVGIGRFEAFARVVEWVDGSAFEWHTVDASVSERVGALMAAVHRVAPPAITPEAVATLPTESNWHELSERAQQRALPWARAVRRALPALSAHTIFAREARDDFQPMLSQRDYHPPNVIAQPDGRLMLIDWDAAGLADANADVAHYAFVWASSEQGDVDEAAARAFVVGYRDVGGRLREPSVSDFAPASVGLLNWIAYNARRDLNNATAGDSDLTLALFEGVRAPDRAVLERRVALLRAANMSAV